MDPVTVDDPKIILESNWGLGEGVVCGAESVDGFVVDKESVEIGTRHVERKFKCVVYTEDHAGWADISVNMQNTPWITDEEINEISKVAKSAEKTLKCAHDMELAVNQDLLFTESMFLGSNTSGKNADHEAQIAD